METSLHLSVLENRKCTVCSKPAQCPFRRRGIKTPGFITSYYSFRNILKGSNQKGKEEGGPVENHFNISWKSVQDTLPFCYCCLAKVEDLCKLQKILEETKKSIEEKFNSLKKGPSADPFGETQYNDDGDDEPEAFNTQAAISSIEQNNDVHTESSQEKRTKQNTSGSQPRFRQPWRYQNDTETDSTEITSNRTTLNLVSATLLTHSEDHQKTVSTNFASALDSNARNQQDDDYSGPFEVIIPDLEDETEIKIEQEEIHITDLIYEDDDVGGNNHNSSWVPFAPEDCIITPSRNENNAGSKDKQSCSKIQSVEDKSIEFAKDIGENLALPVKKGLGLPNRKSSITPTSNEACVELEKKRSLKINSVRNEVKGSSIAGNTDEKPPLHVNKTSPGERKNVGLKTYGRKPKPLQNDTLLKHGITQKIKIVLQDCGSNSSKQQCSQKESLTRSGRTVQSKGTREPACSKNELSLTLNDDNSEGSSKDEENDPDFEPDDNIFVDEDENEQGTDEEDSDGDWDTEENTTSSQKAKQSKTPVLKGISHESELKKFTVVCQIKPTNGKRQAIYNKAILRSKTDGKMYLRGIEIIDDPKHFKCGHNKTCAFFIEKKGVPLRDLYQIMFDHINRHKGKVCHQCRECELFFRSRAQFDSHNNQFHPEVISKLVCKICERPFKYIAEVQRHEWSHYSEEEVAAMEAEGNKDPRKVISVSDLCRTKKKSKYYICKVCGLRFLNEITLKYHLKTKHLDSDVGEDKTDAVNRNDDGQNTSKSNDSEHSKKTLTDETELKKSSVVVYIDVLYKNVGRKPTIFNRAILQSHVTGEKYFRGVKIKDNNETIQCGHHSRCDFSVDKTNPDVGDYKQQYLEMANHIMTHGGKVERQCRPCELAFQSVREYDEHILSFYHPILQGRIIPCPVCERPCKKSFLREHKWTHYSKEEIEELEAAGQSRPTQPKSEKRLNRYVGDLNGITGRIHVCKICDLQFLSAKSLRVHHNKRHPAQPPPKDIYVCELCGSVIRSLACYNKHMKFSHKDGVNFRCRRCEICNEEVKKKGYKAHMRKYHGAPKPFKCDKCKAEFACAHSFKCHTGSDCGKLLKVLKCKYCDKECTHPKTFRNHMLQNHREKIKPKEGKGGPPKVKLPVMTCRRKFPCPLCKVERLFHRPSQLKKHAEKFHPTKMSQGLLVIPTDEEVKELEYIYVRSNLNQIKSVYDELSDSPNVSDEEEGPPIKRSRIARQTRGRKPKRYSNELEKAVKSIKRKRRKYDSDSDEATD